MLRTPANARLPLPVAAPWLYMALCLGWLVSGWGSPQLLERFKDLNPAPMELVLVLYLALSLRQITNRLRRRAWLFVTLSIGVDLVANVCAFFAATDRYGVLSRLSDWLYLVPCPLFAVAYLSFFVEMGGSFRHWRTWSDLLTLALGLGASIWVFLLRPVLAAAPGADPVASHAMLISYSTSISSHVVMAGLVFTFVADWRAHRPLGFLITGTVAAFVANLNWLQGKGVQAFPADTDISAILYCLEMAMIATAFWIEQRASAAERLPSRRDPPPYSFLPTVAVLISIAVFSSDFAYFNDLRRLVLFGCVLGGALLLTARQIGMRRDLLRLNEQLAQRQAEERFSELVRHSTDLIVIVDAQLRLSYVSPAARTVLGLDPEALRCTPAATLFGAENEALLASFIADVSAQRTPNAETSVAFTTPAGEQRQLQVLVNDLRASCLVAGLVLNVRDVTEQHRLEREVLEISAAERERLSSDIHEGLGQELAGIALLLKGCEPAFATAPIRVQDTLRTVVSHFGRAIELSREIARGLSPLQVVHGSLLQGLQQLAEDMSERFGLQVRVLCPELSPPVTLQQADHIFRIAVEALNNAMRHSGCRSIEITVHSDPEQLLLTIADDGIGTAAQPGQGTGLGLRMMQYRARALQGSLRIEQLERGTRVSLSIPLLARSPGLSVAHSAG